MRTLGLVVCAALVEVLGTASPPLMTAAPGQQSILRDRTPPADTASIAGTVRSADGRPLVRAEVRLIPADPAAVARMMRTDRNGHYESLAVAVGRYRVAAEKPGFVGLFYGQRRPFESGRVVELLAGQPLRNIDFVLPRAGAIEGVVRDEFGEPVADAVVVASRNEYLAGMRRLAVASARPARTNDKGEFRLYGLAPSSYYLTAYLESFAGPKVETDVTYGRSYYPGVLNVVEAERVWVRIGEEVQGITITLIPTRSSRISGVAIKADGSLYSNGTVMLRQETAGIARSLGFQANIVRTNSEGAFNFTTVAPGDYTVSARIFSDDAPETASSRLQVDGQDVDNVIL